VGDAERVPPRARAHVRPSRGPRTPARGRGLLPPPLVVEHVARAQQRKRHREPRRGRRNSARLAHLLGQRRRRPVRRCRRRSDAHRSRGRE
jgi:hypothetical protein